MFKKMGIKNRLEDISNSRSKGNRMIVGGIRVVTFLWSRMNQIVLPRSRVYRGSEDRQTGRQSAGDTPASNSLRSLGNIFSRPDAFFVFREENTLRTLRGEIMIRGIS